MQTIALHDADNTGYPNLPLMKLSAWHRAKGDTVLRYESLFSSQYDKVYSSKVFTFTDEEGLFGSVEKGGTGYRMTGNLPDEIEHICPDYDLYGLDYSLGFLTRGCPRKCSWCIVPSKEGDIVANTDFDEFLRHDKVVLMDNNILGSEHGLRQIEKLAKLKIKIDFNQGLDARFIDDSIAKLLAKVQWLTPLRLACDHMGQMPSIAKAVSLLRWHNVKPARYFVYCLIKDVDEGLERIRFLKGLYLDPFAQPYRNFEDSVEPTDDQKRLARWVNHKAIFKSVAWEDYLKSRSDCGAPSNEELQKLLIPQEA